jgi:hypothetical protein
VQIVCTTIVCCLIRAIHTRNLKHDVAGLHPGGEDSTAPGTIADTPGMGRGAHTKMHCRLTAALSQCVLFCCSAALLRLASASASAMVYVATAGTTGSNPPPANV